MSTLTTGLAGQQQLRSPKPEGPNRTVWSSAASRAGSASRRGNLIVICHPDRGESFIFSPMPSISPRTACESIVRNGV